MANMNRRNFKVVEGGLSEHYNTFRDCNFYRCTGTNTRLMGVVALHVQWKKNENPKITVHQFIHLDFSELGPDNYYEVIPEKPHRLTKSEMRVWKEMSEPLGGSQVNLNETDVYFLIKEALGKMNPYLEKEKTPDGEEYRLARLRLELTLEALEDSGRVDMSISPERIIEKVSPDWCSKQETVNYFIMRMMDRDPEAACTITTIPLEELKKSPLMEHGIKTLMKASTKEEKVVPVKASVKQAVATTTQAVAGTENGYMLYRVALDLELRNKTWMITGCQSSEAMKMSSFEAAMQLDRPEYITLFRLADGAGSMEDPEIPMMNACLPVLMPNGTLYVRYNGDNSYVDSYEYLMNNDMYGAYLFTEQGELVIMSPDMVHISMMELDILSSPAAARMKLVKRYKSVNQIFQTFAQMPGANFEDMVETGDPSPDDDY